MTYVNTATGEVHESCPYCDDAEIQVKAMERERRADRNARAKAERALEKDVVTKRDGAQWKAALAYWRAAFPGKNPTATTIKSARATAYFLRLEAGATPEDVEMAIDGAKRYPYVVYGKRVAVGSQSAEATDLQEIVALKNDAMFDLLVEAGRANSAA